MHGFAVAMAWGAGLLILAAAPVAVFVTAAQARPGTRGPARVFRGRGPGVRRAKLEA